MLVLDTSILIDIERKNQEVISQLRKLRSLHPERPAITFAALSEFTYGAFRIKKKLNQIMEELKIYEILNSSIVSSTLFAKLKYKLESQGIVVADFDLLIASVVMAEGATLVTRDKHFKKIPSLDLILID